MIARIVAWSTRHPWIVIALALSAALAGEWARRGLSRDVVPDVSEPQIVLVAEWMGHPAVEVASSVTTVLTSALEGVPGATAVRGTSMSGMAYVDVVFARASGLAAGREIILDRLARARSALPATVRVQVAPAVSSTSWVYQYALADPSHRQSLSTLRRFQDDVLRPALQSIPGVAEVATVGGGAEAVVFEVRSEALRARGLAFTDALATLRSAFAGGAPESLREIETLPVPPQSAPGALLDGRVPEVVTVAAVAQARVTDDMPTGLADLAGSPAVGGVVLARGDADLSRVIRGVRRALWQQRPRLPAGVELVTAYDRLELADRSEHTLLRALGEEIVVVVLVVLVFLLDGRSALVPLITLPIVLMVTFAAMHALRVPATIMSLGGIGIALGMAVDADVVALEACHRALEATRGSAPGAGRRAALLAAAQSFAPAILTALCITALSFLPVLAFPAESGRLLRPLAITKTLVVAAAALVTLTLAPALRDRLLGGRVTPELDNPLTRALVDLYRPFVHFALTRPRLTLVTAGLAVVSCTPLAGRLGGEFFPRIDEGDLLFMPTTLPGVPADQAATQLARQDRAIAAFDEVSTVFGKVGRADSATDPAPLSMGETTVRLRPRSLWPKVHRVRWYTAWAPPALRGLLRSLWPEESEPTTAGLIERLDRATRLPGSTNAWTAPARARMDMMSTGARTPVAIRVVAADAERLSRLGTTLRGIAAGVPGTRSAVFESLGGETWPEFAADPVAMAAWQVDPALVRSTADLLLTGGQLGELRSNGRALRVRVAPEADAEMRAPDALLRDVTVRALPDHSGQPLPLALLGRTTFVTRPASIRTEHGEPVAYVYIDLDDGVDLTGYVELARREVDRALASNELRFEPGERIEWAGQYKLMSAGRARLLWIVPAVALTMLGLLYLQFRSLTEALLVLVSVPFALVGSVWTLFLLGYSLSAPVWIGLLSVVGLAMQTGVVMVVYIDEAFHRRVREGRLRSREDVVAAHAEGTVRRLRPKLMTVTTMAAGLLPLLWSDGAGAEIMKRVAAPMVGGLLTSAFLTLEVLPVLYTMWRCRQLRRAERTGRSIAAIVGAVPEWARG